MENVNDVAPGSSPEQVNDSEVVKTPNSAPVKTEEKVVPFERFKEVNDELARLKKEPVKVVNKALNVEDYIDISASLEGLDQREKERLAREHKLSGRSLKEIREDEDFKLWQSAYRSKVDKEKSALAPSSAQALQDRPKSFTEKLKTASLEEKQKMLEEKGLYKSPRPRADKVHIGTQR